jgi:anaerobic magnesium-protoporphyrin IX monomethyl ester cyclase
MIIFLHPRSGRPANRRFPLSVLSIAAMIEGKEEYAIVDGNLDPRPELTLDRLMESHAVEAVAVSVMPGPQMVAAIPLCKHVRSRHPKVPILWGGYFPSLYTDTALNAGYVDFAIRGQGEDTFVEWLAALRKGRGFREVRGLSYKDDFGLHVHNPERPLRSPNDFPCLPYHRLGNVENYLLPSYLGKRTAVHHASIGCPYRCKFCGVVPIFESRQKTEDPARTAEVLEGLQLEYGIDAVQFYDNNFFLNESRAVEQAELLTPLNLRWWAEGRVDTLLRYSDATLAALKKAGATMIFCGAESSNNQALADMNKQITAEQTLELAARIRKSGIVPEFSFVFGDPRDPETDTRNTIRFIRQIKRLNPQAEIIVQHYIPTPNPDGMYGGIDDRIQFPRTPDEWASRRWYDYTIRRDPALPWLPSSVKRLIDDFEVVISARWPTVQDAHLGRWSRALLQGLSSWRYAFGFYGFPLELAWAQKLMAVRKPRLESL